MTDTEHRPSRTWLNVLTVIAGIAGAVSAVAQTSQFLREGQFLDLAVGVFGVIVVSLVAALLVRRRASAGSAGSDSVPPHIALGAAITFSALLVAGSVLVAVIIVNTPAGRSGSGATPESGPTAAGTPTAESQGWTDDFSDGLDPSRWQNPSDSQLITVTDDQLTFRITQDSSPDDWQVASISPVLPSPSVRIVELDASVEQGTPSDGALYIIVRQESGRESRLGVGPSGAGPGAEPWICLRLPCGRTYDEYDHPAETSFVSGRPERVSIRQSGDHLSLQAGAVTSDAPLDPSPITGVEFRVEAGRNELWAVALDNVTISP